jgi:putative sigma-54 modulation protein
MKIQFTARHFKSSKDQQEMIQSEIDRLERFYERITKCHVILDAEHKARLVAEITISTRGKTLVAKASSDIMGKAIDAAISKIERQLKKLNEKKRDHRMSAKKGAPLPEEDEEEA